MKPKVLLYQVPLEKAKQLTSALAMMGVRTEQVAPGDIYQKVGYLAGADGFVWEEDGNLVAEGGRRTVVRTFPALLKSSANTSRFVCASPCIFSFRRYSGPRV